MENPSTSSMVVSFESLNLSGTSAVNPNAGHPQTSTNLQTRTSLYGPVAILWDIENCPIPSDVRPDDVAGNIRMALRVHPIIKGAVTMFSAYGDFNAFPRRLREGCQRTGVKLVDVPNGRKDAADKAILVDMFLFALDNPPPSSILLISGDVDFAPALHILGQRGYTVILVIPNGVGVSSALCNAGRFVWDWPSVARGESFVPPKGLVSHGSVEGTGYLWGSQLNDNQDGQNEEEAIVYQGVSQSEYASRTNMNQAYGYSRDTRTQSLTEYNSNFIIPSFPSARSHSLPSGLSEVPAVDRNEAQDQPLFVQPGDINGLKYQLMKLLELAGGSLPLARIPAEYHKLYERPLYMQEYGASKLVNLLKKMADAMAVEGRGNNKFVTLCNSADRRDKACNTTPSSVTKKDRKRKGHQEENNDNNICTFTGCYSDGERDVEASSDPADEFDERLEQFKHEVLELLVSCSWKIPLGSFEEVYKQRYKKTLDYSSFGVDDLEELMNKVGDVQLCDEEGSKRKFIVPTS